MAKRRSKGCLFFIILIAIAIGAYFTNPTEQMHQAAAKEKLNKVAENILKKYGVNQSLLLKFGIDLSGDLVDELIKYHISSDNYYVLSITKVNWDQRSQIIGVGAFNKVVISNKVDEIMEQELENYVKEKINGIRIPGIDLKNFNLDLGL